jgi:hypothetical protein
MSCGNCRRWRAGFPGGATPCTSSRPSRRSGDPTVGANVGVTRKIRMIPLTRERKFLARSRTRLKR